jgi:hypothetical protein
MTVVVEFEAAVSESVGPVYPPPLLSTGMIALSHPY